MKKISKILLFMTLLTLLVGAASATDISDNTTSTAGDVTEAVGDLQTVSQSDTTTDEIQTDKSSTKVINKNDVKGLNTKKESTLTANSWETFVTAFNEAKTKNEDTTIFLEQGTYTNNGTLTWNNSNIALTIDGNNQTVNGNQTQVFVISRGCSMILKNMTITNAKAEEGGAIYNKGTLAVTYSTLNNNTAKWGGVIYNNKGTLTITNSTLNNNNAIYGGAIINWEKLTIQDTTLQKNTAYDGGAIDNFEEKYFDIIGCNFTQNHATEHGGAIYSPGYLNATGNNFIENTAGNKETIDLYGWWNGQFKDNHYYSTDISLSKIELSVKDDNESFNYGENVELEFNLQPTNNNHYWDFADGINDITLYINSEEKLIGKYQAYNLTNLKPGKYNVNFTSCNSCSNTVTFTVTGDSDITTDKESYDYYEGIKNMVQQDITDESGQRGTAEVSVKDGDEYIQLLTCHNVKDGYTIQTATLAEALANIYDDLNSSYKINVTYYSDYSNPSSTEFALNIIKQRNTTITYNILNNTETNVQINITVIDAVNHTVIEDASIIVTGDINKETSSGVLADNTLTHGNHTIYVHFNQNKNYTSSDVTIEFTVEIDKDKKIAELEANVTNLSNQLETANDKISELETNLTNANDKIDDLNTQLENANNKINNLTEQLTDTNNQITNLNNTVNDLTEQLDNANTQISNLNDTVNDLTSQLDTADNKINNLNKQLEMANAQITELNNTANNLTRQLDDANNKIDELNTQLDTANNKINNLTEQLTDANNQITILNNTVNNLTKQLDEANNEINTLNEIIKELTKAPLNTTITIKPINSSVGSTVKLTAIIFDENKTR